MFYVNDISEKLEKKRNMILYINFIKEIGLKNVNLE